MAPMRDDDPGDRERGRARTGGGPDPPTRRTRSAPDWSPLRLGWFDPLDGVDSVE